MRKSLRAVALILFCSTVLHAKQQAVVRCTAGSPRWEGKADKFKVTLDNSNPSGECRLSISRGDKELFSTQAKIIDVQAAGIDLNLDTKPDLAFQTGPSGECCWTLHLLSLGKSPEPIGEISNRFPFVARDESGEGIPEFWTQDGALAGGFDGLTAEELGNLPSLAVQWDGLRILDVSSRHTAKYVLMAAKLESGLTPERIAAFRQSDGKLEGSGPEVQPLRKTKAEVLGVFSAYLYSGRDRSAWDKLAQLWPEQDLPRIRKALTDTLHTGLRGRLVQPPVFVNQDCPAPTVDRELSKVGGKVTAPRATYYPDPEYSREARKASYEGTVVLWAIISQDGCISEVRVVRPVGRGLDEKAIEAVRRWKFEPARKNGEPVAVQINIEVNFRLY